MAKVKAVNYKKRRRSYSHTKDKTIIVYPMMPRGFTAAQRAQLRKFEKELLKGKKVIID